MKKRSSSRVQRVLVLSGIAVLLSLLLYSMFLSEIKYISYGSPEIPLVKPSSSTGTAYYVSPTGNDRNDGSQRHPFATIQRAASIVQPGTTVHVLPGIYVQSIQSQVKGAARARITFVSDTKWGARIETQSTRSSWANYGDYVDIRDFDITGSGDIGINNYGSFVHIIGNHVHNYASASCSSVGAAGIDNSTLGTNHSNDVIGNVVDSIGPPIRTPCNLDQGIYNSTPGGSIVNNIVYQIASFGIHNWHASANETIANNLVFECGRGGIIIAADMTLADNFLVTNNIIIHNHQLGIYEFGQVGSHNRYLRNIVFANPINLLLKPGSVQDTRIVDPQLVNYQPDGSGNYHLSRYSPAIGTGTALGAPTTDINGMSRSLKAVDIGPYNAV